MPRTSTAWKQLADRFLTVEQIREVDRIAVARYRMNSLVLMENAALGCVRWLENRFPDGGNAVILCGRGNNGGDGLAITRHMRVLGWTCRASVLGPAEKMSADARANLEILIAGGSRDLLLWNEGLQDSSQHSTLVQWIASATLIIDAMLGTGASGEPKAPLDNWISLANRTSAQRVAIDIPTGWDATTGEPSESTFKADATLTFVARKPAMALPDKTKLLGEIVVLPIGIPEEQIEQLLAAKA
jgi:NAD(P)H-hydrate epimerase